MPSIHLVVVIFLSFAALTVPLECDEPVDGTPEFIEDYQQPGFECKPDDLSCRADSGSEVFFVCDARNYCSGEWFKNDTYPYPFGKKDDYSLHDTNKEYRMVIPNPEKSLEGNYSCILTNGTHNISRDFYLYRVCEEFYEENFVPEAHQIKDACVDKKVKLGEDTLLYCEFCAKFKYNETSLQWFKCVNDSCEAAASQWVPVEQLTIPGTTFSVNRTELINCGQWRENLPGVDQRCTIAAIDSVGSYLHIQGVTRGALGQYKLVATVNSTQEVSEADSIELSEKIIPTLDKTAAVLEALTGIFVFGLVAALLWVKFDLDVKLLVRDRFSKVESRGGRDYDAYIVYNSSSEEITRFVTGVIRPKLIENNYQVFVKDIDMIPGGFRAEDIVDAMNNSLRCILVVSDTFLSAQGQHSELQINIAINDMADRKTKIVPILFGDVSVTALGRLLVVLRCLRFREKKTNESKFLKQLLLRMPVKARTPADNDFLIENVEL